MVEDPERPKLRRWAIEMLAPSSSVQSMTDIRLLCEAADALIEFVMTGHLPVQGDGKDQGNGQSN